MSGRREESGAREEILLIGKPGKTAALVKKKCLEDYAESDGAEKKYKKWEWYNKMGICGFSPFLKYSLGVRPLLSCACSRKESIFWRVEKLRPNVSGATREGQMYRGG